MLPIDTFLVYTVVACIYNRLYDTDDHTLWIIAKNVLQEKECFEMVDSVLNGRCSQKKADDVVKQLSVRFGSNVELCDRIKASQGLRQFILCDFHDAGIAEAYIDGGDLVMSFDLDSGQVMSGVFYRKVMRLRFINVLELPNKKCLEALSDSFVCSHNESVEQGHLKVTFKIARQADSSESESRFSICCDNVEARSISVKDT